MPTGQGLRFGVAALGAAAVLCLPSAGSAATPVSQSFTTHGEQQFVVPPGVGSLQVTLVGGHGAAGDAGAPGGIGATVTATLAVGPGETLYAEVAGNGVALANEPGGNLGGYGGGGEGGLRQPLSTLIGGGGGGGASDVRRCSNNAPASGCGAQQSLASRLLVAGGGGGGGGNGESPSSTAGGSGGSADQPGNPGARNGGYEGGGGGSSATASAGGKAGSPSSVCETSASGCPSAGQLGLGGAGGWNYSGGGGGGGGGIFGGGGGGGGEGNEELIPPSTLVVSSGGGGGGGGGSSGVPAGAAGVSNFSLVPTAEGAQPAIAFTWTPPPPAVLTGAASAVTATTAVLNGTVNPDAWQVSSCTFDISPAPSGVSAFPCAQQLGAGGTALPVTATAIGLAPGTTYTVTLLAASVQGTGSGAAVTFTTTGGGSGSGSRSGPSISALRLSPTQFHRRPHRSRGHKRTATATTISFDLSRAAGVTLSFQRAEPGRLVGRRCLAGARTHRHARVCTLYAPVSGSLTLSGKAGANSISFGGALAGGQRLALGTYRLTLVASDAGGRTTAAQHPTLTLLP